MDLNVVIISLVAFSLTISNCDATSNKVRNKERIGSTLLDDLDYIFGTNWSKVLLSKLSTNPNLQRESLLRGLARIGSLLYPKFMETVKFQTISYVNQKGGIKGTISYINSEWKDYPTVQTWLKKAAKLLKEIVSEKVNYRRRSGTGNAKRFDDGTLTATLQRLTNDIKRI
ncbi:Uncharacterised protein g10429 [Pycnogonum litorale]